MASSRTCHLSTRGRGTIRSLAGQGRPSATKSDVDTKATPVSVVATVPGRRHDHVQGAPASLERPRVGLSSITSPLDALNCVRQGNARFASNVRSAEALASSDKRIDPPAQPSQVASVEFATEPLAPWSSWSWGTRAAALLRRPWTACSDIGRRTVDANRAREGSCCAATRRNPSQCCRRGQSPATRLSSARAASDE